METEGLARDLVRRIQSLRKDANFDINDQIRTYFNGDLRIEEVFHKELDYIMIETLSDKLIKGEAPKNAKIQEYEIDGLKIRIGVEKSKRTSLGIEISKFNERDWLDRYRMQFFLLLLFRFV